MKPLRPRALAVGAAFVLAFAAFAAPAAGAPGDQPSIDLEVKSLLGSGKKVVAVPRVATKVRGKVRPYTPGASVVVTVGNGRRVIRKLSRPVVQRGDIGIFKVKLKLRRRGRYVVRAEQSGAAGLPPLKSRARRLFVVRPGAASGATGLAVRALQRRLNALGYLTPVNGQFGASTGRAVLALRKVTGMARNTLANGAVFRKLAKGGGRFRLRFPKAGKHAEFDWSRQVLVLAQGSRVVRIVPGSSGKPSTPTVFGHFHFYSKVPGYNSKGMYYSTFFVSGYAVHGYAEVPVYAASHGCIRIPIASAISVYRWLTIGTRMFVYR
jgi:peptidoglycan hydrolase-like protein with peptidoglycan-binding domain